MLQKILLIFLFLHSSPWHFPDVVKQGKAFFLHKQQFVPRKFADFLQLHLLTFKIFSGATSLSLVIGLKLCPFLNCHPHSRRSN